MNTLNEYLALSHPYDVHICAPALDFNQQGELEASFHTTDLSTREVQDHADRMAALEVPPLVKVSRRGGWS